MGERDTVSVVGQTEEETDILPAPSRTYLEPHRLEHFLAAYKTRNFHRAAALNGISQQGVSKAVSKLEEILGVPLFDRMPGGVEPTIYADHLARRARLILAESRLASLEIAALRGSRRGEVRVGVGPSFAPRLFPRAAAKLRRRAPDIGLMTYVGHTQRLAPLILSGDIEFAVAAPPYGLTLGLEIEVEKIYEELDVVVGRVGHPLADNPDRGLKDYTKFPWVAPIGLAGSWSRVVDLFASQGVDPPCHLYRTDTVSLAIGHMLEGDALCLTSSELVVNEIAGSILQPITHPVLQASRSVLMMKRKQSTLTPSAALLYSIVNSTLKTDGTPYVDNR